MPFRVLFVEDDPAVLQLFRTVLELDGFQVETASGAKEALSILANRSYDLVVTDMRMETSTAGYDVVHAAARLTQRPVIVILTAFYLPSTDWKNSGADALFVKGTNVTSLTEQLRTLLRAHGKTDDPPDPLPSERAMRATGV